MFGGHSGLPVTSKLKVSLSQSNVPLRAGVVQGEKTAVSVGQLSQPGRAVVSEVPAQWRGEHRSL